MAKQKTLPNPIPLDYVWTVRTLADHNHVGPQAILNLIYNGVLEAYVVSIDAAGNHKWRITHQAWLNYSEKRKCPTRKAA